MGRQKSHARLGLFVVVALALLVLVVVLYGLRGRKGESIELVTYFDEPVTGLEVGSAILLRGVKVGRVDSISIATTAHLVEVGLEIDNDVLIRLGSSEVGLPQKVKQGLYTISPDLRVQIQRSFLSGRAWILIDVRPNAPIPFVPDFDPPRPMINSMPSTTQNLYESIEIFAAKIPELLDRANVILERIDVSLRDSDLQRVSEEAKAFLRTATDSIERVTTRLDDLLAPRGPVEDLLVDARTDLGAMRERLDSTLGKAEQTIEDAEIRKVSRELQALLNEMRQVGQGSDLLVTDLRNVLPALRDSLQQIAALARRLERQPESLIYGRKPRSDSK
ncbi:MAG: MlaD family protein [Planctomycetota bacterium]